MHAEGGLALWAAQCGADSAAQLAAFLDANSTRDELLLAAEADKGVRRATHALVRSHFPSLTSEVAGPPPAVRLRRQPPLKAIALDLAINRVMAQSLNHTEEDLARFPINKLRNIGLLGYVF